jgi:hypothetical protein
MEKKLIGFGVLSGAIAGLFMFAFARIFAEPVIQRAIDYESGRDAAQQALDKAAGLPMTPEGHELFSRTVQGDIGSGAALVLFGVATGALFAVAYCVCIGRTGRVRPRPLALLVAAAGFVSFYLVPFMKYPANPPAVGHEETIGDRSALYLLVLACSVLFMFLAVYVGQRLAVRWDSTWNASVVCGLAHLVLMGIVFLILPPFGHLHANVAEYGKHATETPLPLTDDHGTIVFPGFPADVLAQFRAYSVAAQLILWGLIGLIFAPLADRVLSPSKPTAAAGERVPAGA